MTGAGQDLGLTGERTLPHLWPENYWFRRHQAAYAHLIAAYGRHLRGAVLLEAGCGEGYGAQMLLDGGAGRVLALDYDEATVGHVRTSYPRVEVVRGNLVALPLPAAAVDAVVSLQTVEHLWDQPAFAAGCARVLRPGGLLAVSTPNRRTFPRGNLFHTTELETGDLAALLHGRVRDLELLGVGHGPRITAHETAHGSLVAAQLSRSYADWDPDLVAFVRSVRADDFVVTTDAPEHPIAQSLDLLAVGWGR